MSLIELEEQLAFARKCGAENYDTVYLEVEITDSQTGEKHAESGEPERASLERRGRREIVIR